MAHHTAHPGETVTRLSTTSYNPSSGSAPVIAQSAPAPLMRGNASIARDFLDLSFQMERGSRLPVLTRFEGPIIVRLIGQVNTTMARDLGALIGRLRAEAGINIAQTSSPNAHITIQAVPSRALHQAASHAACMVVPRVSDWNGYLSARGTGALNWTTLQTRQKAAVFVPADLPPQEVRDCLHEELAQALGPLNDLYRLPDSVFNDDAVHAVLTSFDMTILRAYYHPQLHSGMSRAEVAARLPAILQQINPDGTGRRDSSPASTIGGWRDMMMRATAASVGQSGRQAAAQRAVRVGQAANLSDHRQGFALYAYGRSLAGQNDQAALSAFQAADALFARSRQTQLHRAFTAAQLANYALRSGNPRAALSLTQGALPAARAHQNATLVATLMWTQAEAHKLLGNETQAQRLYLDSMPWARYGFGSESVIRAQMQEIASLAHRPS